MGLLLSSAQKTQGTGEQLCAQETSSWTLSLKARPGPHLVPLTSHATGVAECGARGQGCCSQRRHSCEGRGRLNMLGGMVYSAGVGEGSARLGNQGRLPGGSDAKELALFRQAG